MKDGARSSLPQYRQTNFSAVDVARADCCGRREALLVFTGCAGFGWAATAFLVDCAVSRSRRCLWGSSDYFAVFAEEHHRRFVISGHVNLLVALGLGAPGPSFSSHGSVAAAWEAGSAPPKAMASRRGGRDPQGRFIFILMMKPKPSVSSKATNHTASGT
jgi:hypothetical protein